MFRDFDFIVVVNFMMVFEEIFSKEGGIVINKNIVNYFLNNLKDMIFWG